MAVFDKKRLSELLIQAQGSRTREKFAQDAGISLPQMSKFIKGLENGPPKPATLSKIMAASWNTDVSYSDLMVACGYGAIVREENIPARLQVLLELAHSLSDADLEEIEAIMRLKVTRNYSRKEAR